MSSDKPYGVGIRRLRTSWEVFARVRGTFYSKTYPLDTPLDKLTKHRAALVAEATFAPPPAPRVATATLADDAAVYLSLVTKMPTYKDRAYRIGEWVKVLGHRVRSTITSRDIRTVLERWLKDGRDDGKGLSIASWNQRRTALMSLYTVLDGKSAPNIVRDVPAHNEHGTVKKRDVPMVTISRVLRAMPIEGLTRARLRALQWTGWPASLVTQLRPQDLDLQRERVYAPARKKGKGFPAAWVSVSVRTLSVLRYFFRVGAQGKFSNSSLHKALGRYCHQLGVTPFNVYALKHSFGTWAAPVVKDNDALKDLLRTNSIHRYVEGAREARMEAARDAIEAAGRAARRARVARIRAEKSAFRPH